MPASLGKRKRIFTTIPASSKLLKVSKSALVIPEPVPGPRSSDSSSSDLENSGDGGEDEDDNDSEPLDPQEIFRRHFEAQFKPLPPAKKLKTTEETENKEDDDWEGLSDNSAEEDDEEDDEEEDNGVQVVEHTKKVDSRIAGMSKGELRAFMANLSICSIIYRIVH